MVDERGPKPDPDNGSAEEQDEESAEEPAAAANGPRFRIRRVVAPRSGDGDRERVESRDETDVGWGDPPGRRDDDWYRRERPPHHG